MCPGGPMGLRRYGELGGRACDDDSDRPCASTVGGRVVPGAASAWACWLPLSRAMERRSSPQDEVTPCRLRVEKSRSMGGRTIALMLRVALEVARGSSARA